jgi:hypothetical protein
MRKFTSNVKQFKVSKGNGELIGTITCSTGKNGTANKESLEEQLFKLFSVINPNVTYVRLHGNGEIVVRCEAFLQELQALA